MMPGSGGLKPSAVAGSPSVTRFTHNSCTGFSTSGIPAQAHTGLERHILLQHCARFDLFVNRFSHTRSCTGWSTSGMPALQNLHTKMRKKQNAIRHLQACAVLA